MMPVPKAASGSARRHRRLSEAPTDVGRRIPAIESDWSGEDKLL
jgi:hypothetical protein